MKTQFKYIHFQPHPRKTKTGMWLCCSTKTGHQLGEIKWCGQWRQFCFYPEPDCLFSAGCLNDITTFIDGLKAAWVDQKDTLETTMNAKAQVLAAYPTAEIVEVECFAKDHHHPPGHNFKRLIVMAEDGSARILSESTTVEGVWREAGKLVEEETR